MSAFPQPELHQPAEHQQAAIRAAMLGLEDHDRGQLVMACGTGKTLTALRFAETRGADRVLVLLPSLSLLAQTLREWLEQSRTPFRPIAVCSDPTVTGTAEEVPVVGDASIRRAP